jgi:aryl-alcohol dehydrogenase-like predicted oxidoreductase
MLNDVRYVDVARSYGLAEQFLASWLKIRALGPGGLTVGSKWGYTYTGGWRRDATHHEVKDHSLETFERQLAESRDLLGPFLQLYQVHSATFESGVLEDQRVLAALLRLRSAGLAVGLTVSGPSQSEVIRRALRIRVDGINPFQTIQATWNLLEPSAGSALAEAHAEGIGVIVKEVLANGRLTDRNAGTESAPLLKRSCETGATLDALSIAAALSNPWADVVLSGAATAAQLRSNLAGVTSVVEVSDLPEVAQPPDYYWARRAALSWN